jgi:hypothetical protein
MAISVRFHDPAFGGNSVLRLSVSALTLASGTNRKHPFYVIRQCPRLDPNLDKLSPSPRSFQRRWKGTFAVRWNLKYSCKVLVVAAGLGFRGM